MDPTSQTCSQYRQAFTQFTSSEPPDADQFEAELRVIAARTRDPDLRAALIRIANTVRNRTQANEVDFIVINLTCK